MSFFEPSEDWSPIFDRESIFFEKILSWLKKVWFALPIYPGKNWIRDLKRMQSKQMGNLLFWEWKVELYNANISDYINSEHLYKATKTSWFLSLTLSHSVDQKLNVIPRIGAYLISLHGSITKTNLKSNNWMNRLNRQWIFRIIQ